jgi:hypothetical protein
MSRDGGWEVIMNKDAVIAGACVVLLAAVAGCGGQSQTVGDTDTVPAAPAESASADTGVSATGAAPVAGERANAATPTAASAPLPRPIRGVAEVQLTKPVTRRVGNAIVTTMQVKNPSPTGSIVGLRIDEFWYDKAGTPVTGDTFRHRMPLRPGEIVDVTLRTPVNPRMDRNQYQFAHANGEIKTTIVPRL